MAYFGIFSNDKDVFTEFDTDYDRDINILIAYYGDESYEGNAYVLFMKGSKLYEVCAGHCSCFGLEGQWDPEETSWDVIDTYVDEGSLPYMWGLEGSEIAGILRSFKQLQNLRIILE